MDEPSTYQIVIRGRAGDRILGPLGDDFTIDHPNADQTRLTGVIRDPAHLHGVLAHLTSVAIDIVSIVPTEPFSPTQFNQPSERQSND